MYVIDKELLTDDICNRELAERLKESDSGAKTKHADTCSLARPRRK
jgi:hypothetical protein